jgi:nucleoside-diphosphate-sugar epimerase
MIVAIAGAHGKIALRLSELLTGRGDGVVGLIRNPDHAADVEQQGATTIVCDLEQATVDDVRDAIDGADAVVFAAGAGPGSGAERKLTMDRDGAIKLLDAAAAAGVRRYVIISAVGAESPPDGGDVFSVYLRAKAQADQAVASSDREWTIVRPGGLTDDAGTGRVRVQTTPFRGQIARDDVAAVLLRVLDDARTSGVTLYVNGGEHPVDEAVDQLFAAGDPPDGSASVGD